MVGEQFALKSTNKKKDKSEMQIVREQKSCDYIHRSEEFWLGYL